MAAIAGLRDLEELDISWCDVDDAVMEWVATMPHLRKVWLNSSDDSAASVARFHDARPDIEIISE